MKIFKRFLDFYIDCSIHVAFAVFSLLQITKLSLDIETDISLDYFIFFGTILGYNFLKYIEVFRSRTYTLKQNYLIIIVSIIAFFVMIYFYYQLTSSIQIAFLKIGIVVVLYPFLRKYGFLKMFIVAFCVAYITVFIPEINYDLNWMYLLQRFIIVICLLIPLEICDLETDSKTLKTLPKIIGIQNLKNIGYFLLFLFCVIAFYFFKVNIAIDIVIASVISIYTFFSDEKRSKYYTSFCVESIPIFWWVLLLIFLK